MPQESTAIEQAVSRAIRDNLERIQRTTDELNQAVNDVVAACASSKPTNALPPMLRAQSTAASIAAALEVLSRFVAVTLQPGPRSPLEAEMTRLTSTITAESARLSTATEPAYEPAPREQKLPETAETKAPQIKGPEKVTQPPVVHEPIAPVSPAASHPVVAEPPKPAPKFELPPAKQQKPEFVPAYKTETYTEPEPLELPQAGPFPEDAEVEAGTDFNVSRLSAEEQELHRRANRVAKVSMQDIKMLRPEQVRLGREKKDLCIRLRDDIEKAHREYDRRFRPIMDHPVDYFYRWMVEILADGDAHALGEYPYAVHANQR
jgi:hypothetical protein